MRSYRIWMYLAIVVIILGLTLEAYVAAHFVKKFW
jgi:hypothetical protein